jgi:PAS domain S-box-containing protein
LHELPEAFVTLVNRSPIPVTVADATRPDHPLVLMNDAFARLTGYEADEVIGRNCRFLQGPGTDVKVRRAMAQALSEGRQVIGTLCNYTRQGLPFDNFLIIRRIADPTGQPRYFLGCQYRYENRVDAPSLHSHVEVEDALYAEFQRSMNDAHERLDDSRRASADALFSMAAFHLKRSAGRQALLQVGT